MVFFRVFRRTRRKVGLALSRARYVREREEARAVVHGLLARFAPEYGVIPKKVFIKNTRSRWGSASSKGNLNFSVRILELPPELREYIVVHEICHLLHLHHGKAFWDIVARTIPDHVLRRRMLRGFERAVIRGEKMPLE
jgi:predicted metal-dependent hydrolase